MMLSIVIIVQRVYRMNEYRIIYTVADYLDKELEYVVTANSREEALVRFGFASGVYASGLDY